MATCDVPFIPCQLRRAKVLKVPPLMLKHVLGVGSSRILAHCAVPTLGVNERPSWFVTTNAAETNVRPAGKQVSVSRPAMSNTLHA